MTCPDLERLAPLKMKAIGRIFKMAHQEYKNSIARLTVGNSLLTKQIKVVEENTTMFGRVDPDTCSQMSSKFVNQIVRGKMWILGKDIISSPVYKTLVG